MNKSTIFAHFRALSTDISRKKPPKAVPNFIFSRFQYWMGLSFNACFQEKTSDWCYSCSNCFSIFFCVPGRRIDGERKRSCPSPSRRPPKAAASFVLHSRYNVNSKDATGIRPNPVEEGNKVLHALGAAGEGLERI